MVPVVHPALILNFDATLYATAMDSQNNNTVLYIKKNVTTDLDGGDKINNKLQESLFQFYIKYYLLMNAEGLVSTPIYVIADDNVLKGDCVIEGVLQLCFGHFVDDTVYIVFSNNRSVNESFYFWYIKTS